MRVASVRVARDDGAADARKVEQRRDHALPPLCIDRSLLHVELRLVLVSPPESPPALPLHRHGRFGLCLGVLLGGGLNRLDSALVLEDARLPRVTKGGEVRRPREEV